MITLRDEISIRSYFSELSRIPECQPIKTKEEETELFNLYYKTKDKKYKDRIIMSNLKLVISFANMYKKYNDKVKFEDLINEGNLALIESFDHFDCSYPGRFTSFCHFYLKTALEKYTQYTVSDIKQASNFFNIYKTLKSAERQLIMTGRDVNDIALYEMYYKIKTKNIPNISMNRMQEILNNRNNFKSMSSSFNDDDDTELSDFLHSTDNSTDELVKRTDNEIIIDELLHGFKDNEKYIILHTYGILGSETKTLEQIANDLGFTRERIGQILNKCLKTLQNDKSKIKLLQSCI